MFDTATLRLLETDDLVAWLAIEHACFPDPWSESQLLAQLKQTRSRCFGFFQLNQLVAFAVFTTVLDEAELLQIAVSPESRGEGLASALLTQAIDVLQHEGVSRYLLEVRASNTPAIKLYGRAGFVEDGRRKGYYPVEGGREDAVLMSLSVKQS